MTAAEQPPEMRTYQCFKMVQAFKIEKLTPQEDGCLLISEEQAICCDSTRLRGSEACRIQVHVPQQYMEKHDPKAGGYFVRYADGYASYSPAKAFEEGYAPVHLNTGAGGLRFGQAQICLGRGQRVARAGWNGKGMWLEFVPGHGQDLPFYRMHYPVGSAAYPEGARVPWLASQTDMLARDWEVVCG